MAGVALLVGAAAACTTTPQGGSQTGHDQETDGNACEETVTVLGSLEEATALGFTAGEVLAQGEGTFESPIVWLPPGETVSASPEQGEGQLTLVVRHTGGELRAIASRPKESDDGSEGGPALAEGQCQSRLEVDVELTITTSGGALTETVAAILSSADPRIVALDAELDPEALAGSLVVTPQMEGFTLAELSVHGGMAAGVSWGSIDAQVEYADDQVAGVGFASIARWPTAETCDGGGAALPLDMSLLAFTAEDALATADGVAATFTWDDGATTPLTLSLEATSTVACISVGTGFEEPGITFPGRLHMTSEDGRVDSVVEVGVRAVADAEGNLVEVGFQNGGYLTGVAAADFESTYGVTGFDVSGYDQASIEVNGLFAGGGSTGALEVLGLEIPDCISNPEGNGSGGCEGVTATELGGGAWN